MPTEALYAPATEALAPLSSSYLLLLELLAEVGCLELGISFPAAKTRSSVRAAEASSSF